MQLKGIDVSRHQGQINWAQVKASGVQFAIIRCGYANKDGSITVDVRYHENMKQAIQNNIPVGVYVYSYVESVDAAADSARRVLELVKGYKVDYPLVWDYELSALYAPYGKVKNTDICIAALNVWQQAKYYAMLYTYKFFATGYLDMSRLASYDFWLAHYTKDGLNTPSSYVGAYGMWQYTSDGNVPGISGRVDLNVAYKDYKSIINGAGLNGTGDSDTRPAEPASNKMFNIDIEGISKGDKNAVVNLLDELELQNYYTVSEV